MLSLMALHFPGKPIDNTILQQACADLASQTVQTVCEWSAEPRVRERLCFASNFALVNITFASVLALRVRVTLCRQLTIAIQLLDA